MKLSKQKLKGVIISAIIVGIIADLISVSDGHVTAFLGFWTGFALFLPLSIYISLKILGKIEIKNTILAKIFLPILFAFMVIAVMVFTFELYDFREGPGSPSDMYGMVYLLGFIPAAIIGFVYGLIIAFNLEKNELPKLNTLR